MKFYKILWPLSICASVLVGSPVQAESAGATNDLSIKIQPKADFYALQRKKYQSAQKAFNNKQTAEFQRLTKQLDGYPLTSYLEYQDLVPRLINLPYREVENFFKAYPDSFLAERMTHRWLRTLAQREKWADYQRFYDPRLTDPELACLNLRARLETGDKSVFADVAQLWNIEDTQSKACDPVFNAWTKAGGMTPELIWSRHLKVVKAGNPGMARYLAGLLPANKQPLAQLLQAVNSNPKLLRQTGRFSSQSPEMKDIILFGLEKLARQDAVETLNLWQKYDAQQLFNDEDRIGLKYQIALRLLYQNQEVLAEQLVAQTPNLTRVDLVEWLIRESLRKQDWEKVNEWLTRLPEDARQTDRWRYWQARAMEELNIKEFNNQTPMSIYASIAAQRSFYGFLAADKTDIDYHLLDRPVTFTQTQLEKLERTPGIARAREFYLLNQVDAASREWYFTIRRLDPADIPLAGKLAESWGWYRQGIQAMVDANYWDDLTVRFPIAYREHVNRMAQKTAVNPMFIFAVARQESAFMHTARSPAGAMGLMQLLPSTAKQTARKNGLSFNKNDLLTPEKNITLGSHYLNHLLDEFDGNRILVAAAYNAGPNRVKQWLSKEKSSQLPYDVWIETIPFKETRGYVQNVLSFSVIYAYRLGEKQRFITPQEAVQQL